MIALSVAAALLCAGAENCALQAPAQPAHLQGEPIEIGRTFKLTSTALGEERVINVHLPPGYATGDKRYPLLFLIDGGVDQDFPHVVGTAELGAIWGRSQAAIIVGVATKDRRRELVGPTRDPELLKRYPTAGQSANFRRFIRDEVMPLVEARYRTDGTTAVLGESLAGLLSSRPSCASPTCSTSMPRSAQACGGTRNACRSRRRGSSGRGMRTSASTSRPPMKGPTCRSASIA
jgi:hypothetical protein